MLCLGILLSSYSSSFRKWWTRWVTKLDLLESPKEAYFAQLYLSQVGNASYSISYDLWSSDAINIAVRCKESTLKLL
ncbi:PREDICTED: bifunctional nuclease-like [Camelina sativa]|uniref:Bifunctional nuclease-like n=1 Tax=Camelina sativa TaxID=90675 RepID=A0ABM1R452_CAMSA|nr:PREDICTED: bifunctional nuclease-like [Camelina sativa]